MGRWAKPHIKTWRERSGRWTWYVYFPNTGEIFTSFIEWTTPIAAIHAGLEWIYAS